MSEIVAATLTALLTTRDRVCSDRALRRSVVSLVRRRVPAPDVEDVVQSIYEAAVAAREWPPPHEARAWLFGIARHKVADYLRARRPAPIAIDDDVVAQGPAPFEVRDLLARIVREASADEQRTETLSWLVREHEGESLGAIAREKRVSAESVRQRVSRMRRALRLQWAAMLALVFLAGGATWHALHDTPRIVADASTRTVQPASIRGSWTIDIVETRQGLDAARAAAASARALSSTIAVHDDRVTLVEPTGRHELSLAVEPDGANLRLHLTAEGRDVHAIATMLDDGRAAVDLDSGDITRIILRRAR